MMCGCGHDSYYTTPGTSKEPGVLPRTLDVIFNSIKHCHFLGHTVKPKFFAEATHLTDSEQEEDKAIKTALLNKVCVLYTWVWMLI